MPKTTGKVNFPILFMDNFLELKGSTIIIGFSARNPTIITQYTIGRYGEGNDDSLTSVAEAVVF